MRYRFDIWGILEEPDAEELKRAEEAGSAVIILSQGDTSDGRPYWLYIAVKPSKHKEFRQLTAEHQPIIFAKYGEILRYGYDKEVPKNIKKEMEDRYGCSDSYMDSIAREVKEEQEAFLRDKEEKDKSHIGDIIALLRAESSGNKG